MATIKAGTTGKADVSLATNPSLCAYCHAPGTFGFGTTSVAAPGWAASFDDETVTVPPEAAPGNYMIGVRSSNGTSGPSYAGVSGTCTLSAFCKHLDFTVVAADAPADTPGPGCSSC